MVYRFTCCIAVLLCVNAQLRSDDRQDPSNASIETSSTISSTIDRSPIAVAVSPDRRFCVSANHTSDSVTVFDLRGGRIVCEHRCGRGPADVIWLDSTHLLVSLLHDDAVGMLNFDEKQLTIEAVIPVGDEPRGIAALSSPSGGTAFVALSGFDEIAVVNLDSRKVVKRISVGGHPKTLAVSPNQRWLVTCCSTPGEVFVHDLATFRLLSRRTVFDEAFNLGVPVVGRDSTTCILPHAVNRTFPVSEDNIEKGWAIDNRLTKLPLPDGEYWRQKQLALDKRGDATGDAHAVALSPNEQWLVVTCGGSHELMIFPRRDIPWPAADPGDFLPDEVLSKNLLRRVELGGRPLGVQFIDDRRVVIANYLLNALQIVDVASAKLIRSISLGGPEVPSLPRRGEAIFYDADRSLNSWFSCHTCHTDGHTTGQTFDTLNDGNYDTHKLTPSLRGVTRTGPWTWHGWQTSLDAAMRKSLRGTLATKVPIKEEDVEALVAFLRSLEHCNSPFRRADGSLNAPARRGKSLFENKADCISCHSGSDFTSSETFKVGLESKRYFYPEFNPPSLRGLHTRRRFLHDGRGDDLHEVLTRHHRPEKLTGKPLSEDELRDLIDYLKSL